MNTKTNSCNLRRTCNCFPRRESQRQIAAISGELANVFGVSWCIREIKESFARKVSLRAPIQSALRHRGNLPLHKDKNQNKDKNKDKDQDKDKDKDWDLNQLYDIGGTCTIQRQRQRKRQKQRQKKELKLNQLYSLSNHTKTKTKTEKELQLNPLYDIGGTYSRSFCTHHTKTKKKDKDKKRQRQNITD